MLVNTELFRIQAKHYEKHKRYDDGTFGTLEYERFWREEIAKCRDGVSIGDTWISGYHYFYLNYWRIMKVSKKESGLVERDANSVRSRGERIESFPDFWDVDFEFFQEVEKAEKNGQHMVWLKPRGVGASWKGASMAARNFFLFKQSKSYLVADEKEYLIKDGIITKFKDGREFILRTHPLEKNRFTVGFAKPSDFKKSLEGMHYRASTRDPNTGEEIGFMSELIGISVKDDPEKPRGKRGKLIIYEEMGKFPNVDTVWNISRSSVEEQDLVYGLMLGFGTGGSEGSNFNGFEKMFYNPKAYNIRCFDNIYDEGMIGSKCAFFTPAYKTIQFKDKNGNSDIERGKKHIKFIRKEASESPDPNALLQAKAEHPECPQEAILNTGYKILPAQEAKEWRLQVETTQSYNLGMPGILANTGNGIVFFPNKNEHPPLRHFPYNIKKDDLHGAIVIYHPPIKDRSGTVPKNLYIIGVDPYAQDGDGGSVGAVYVYMNPTNMVGAAPGDKIVATYFGRPKTQDDFNKNVFLLAEYYNAMVGIENDAGDTVGYAKRFKKLDWLQEQFECGWDETIKTKTSSKRAYGMSINSGRENRRKLQGDKYLADSLLTPRTTTASGKTILNLHTIHCLFTLRQIEEYNLDGNFDAIAALRILEYFKKELDYKDIKVETRVVKNSNSFFNKQLFR